MNLRSGGGLAFLIQLLDFEGNLAKSMGGITTDSAVYSELLTYSLVFSSSSDSLQILGSTRLTTITSFNDTSHGVYTSSLSVIGRPLTTQQLTLTAFTGSSLTAVTKINLSFRECISGEQPTTFTAYPSLLSCDPCEEGSYSLTPTIHCVACPPASALSCVGNTITVKNGFFREPSFD